AQILLVQRQDTSVVPEVRRLARSAADWRTKLHAMGVLDGLGALDVETVQAALKDPHPDVRAWGIRWSEQWIGEPGHPLAAEVLALIDDPNWIVRRQLAATIGELPAPQRIDAAVQILQRYGGDAITVDAVISGLHTLEQEVFSRLVSARNGQVEGEAVQMLAATIGREGQLDRVQAVLAAAVDSSRPAPIRRAILEGLESGLPAAGGGRGGGFGAGGFAGGRGGRGAAPARTVRLPGEPEALTALANGDSD